VLLVDHREQPESFRVRRPVDALFGQQEPQQHQLRGGGDRVQRYHQGTAGTAGAGALEQPVQGDVVGHEVRNPRGQRSAVDRLHLGERADRSAPVVRHGALQPLRQLLHPSGRRALR